ncbi:MAG: MBL fold metallo-hydrolase [Pseudobdellovibrio sp.]
MDIHFWGVRGSIPGTLNTINWAQHFHELMHEFFKDGNSHADQIESFIEKKTLPYVGGYGTATTCIEIKSELKSLIIDTGSGIKNLNDFYETSGIFKTENEFHILMSHFHLDHIIGIPFFTPHFMKGKKINYYAVQSETESIVRQMFQKPIFPVTFEALQAEIKFHTIKPYAKHKINGFDVTAYQLDHPDPCFGFRIEKDSKVYAHAVDHEAVRVSERDLGPDAELFKNANLLYFDAQYSEADMKMKKGWGHGTCNRGFEVSANFNVQQILFAHHDPSADIKKIWQQKKDAEQILKSEFAELAKKKEFVWDYAYEGQVVKI